MTNATENLMNTDVQYHTSSLNILRFLAAVMVVVCHIPGISIFANHVNGVHNINFYHTYERLFRTNLTFSAWGQIGVLFFFLISGFLMVRMQERYSPKELLINRIFRIYPVLIVAIIFVTCTDHKVHSVIDTILSMTMMAELFGIKGYMVVLWTLLVEIAFYITSAYIVKWDLQKINKSLYIITFINITAFLLYKMDMMVLLSRFSLMLFGLVFLLFIGTAIALRAKISMIMKIYGFAIFNGFITAGTSANNNGMIKAHMFLMPFVVVMFYAFLKSEQLNEMGKSKLWHNLSGSAYGIYLFHIPIGYVLSDIYVQVFQIRQSPTFLIVQIILSILMGYIMHKTVEKWGIQAGRTIIKKMRL